MGGFPPAIYKFMMNSGTQGKNKTAVWARPALWLLCAGAIGTVVFAAALAFKLTERRRDAAYYDSLASSFFITVSADAASADAASADAVIFDDTN